MLMQYFVTSPVLTRNVCGWSSLDVTSWKSLAMLLTLAAPRFGSALRWGGWSDILLEPASAYTTRIFRLTL